MLDKPELPDKKIIATLREAYGLDIAEIAFLPLGADLRTAEDLTGEQLAETRGDRSTRLPDYLAYPKSWG